eukprot:6038352-Pyramimonas_sp.AAC.1
MAMPTFSLRKQHSCVKSQGPSFDTSNAPTFTPISSGTDGQQFRLTTGVAKTHWASRGMRMSRRTVGK